MTSEALRSIIHLLMQDSDFRNLFQKDPQKALSGYELEPGELKALIEQSAEILGDDPVILEARISRGLTVLKTGNCYTGGCQ